MSLVIHVLEDHIACTIIPNWDLYMKYIIPSKLFIFNLSRKFTRRASKRCCVLFAAVWRERGVIIRHVLFAAGVA